MFDHQHEQTTKMIGNLKITIPKHEHHKHCEMTLPMIDGKINFDMMDFTETADYLTKTLDKQEKLLTDGILHKFQELNDQLID